MNIPNYAQKPPTPHYLDRTALTDAFQTRPADKVLRRLKIQFLLPNSWLTAYPIMNGTVPQ